MRHLIKLTVGRIPVQSVLVLALTVSLAWPVAAATIVVDTLEDNQGAVDACSLRAAIINANNDDQSGSSNCQAGDGFDSITFDAGLANGTIETNGTALPTISDSLTIQGPEVDDASGMTIDARGLSRIVKLSEAGPTTLVMDSITLTGGRTSGESLEGGGAALHAFASEIESPHVVVLDHVRLSGNSTAGQFAVGGAVLSVNATMTLENTQVSGNWTEGDNASGGGLFVSTTGDQGGAALLALFDSRVANNTVEGDFGMGGGIMAIRSRVEATDSEIVGNATLSERGFGGGVRLGDGSLKLTRSALKDNTTAGPSSSGGGAMVIGSVTLVESQVTGNETAGDTSLGGGLAVGFPPIVSTSTSEIDRSLGFNEPHDRGIALDEIRLTVTDSTISGNSTAGPSSHGGGILVHEKSSDTDAVPAHLELENSTVANNSTSGDGSSGGGIAVVNSDTNVGTATLRNATVSNNTTAGADSPGGGLVAALTDVSLTHATLAFNQADVGVDGIVLFDTTDTDFELANSMIVQSGADEEACSHAATSDSNSLATDPSCTGTASEAADLALQPLSDNGGPTLTHAPAASSLAINAAGNCVEQQGITEDQRGQPRPGGQSTNCDVGAFERQDTESDDIVFADRFQAD